MLVNRFQNNNVLYEAQNNGWELYKFTDIFVEESRKSRKIKESDYHKNGEYPIVDQGKTLIGGYTDIDNGYYENVPFIIFGDHTKVIKFIDFPAFIGADGVKIIKNQLEEKALSKYLYYFLKTIELPDAGYNRHFKFLKETVIPIPPIEIQKNIIYILDKLNAVINKRQQQIQAISSLKKSIFLDMFGDPNNPNNKNETKKIKDLFNVKTGSTPSRKNKSYWENGNVPWIKTTELKGNIISNSEEFVTDKAINETNLKMFPAGTILIAMYGQGKTRGESGLLSFPASTNQACAALVPCNNLNVKFMWYQIILQYESLRKLGRGGNQPNLNLNIIKEFNLIDPPMDFQKAFESKIDEIEVLEENKQESLFMLKDLYNALLQKLFSDKNIQKKTIRDSFV